MMRRLNDYEEIGLIDYPCNGQYISMLRKTKSAAWLLGGELCGLNGTSLADQAWTLHRYYPQGNHLVLATIRDGWLIKLKDYYGVPESGLPA